VSPEPGSEPVLLAELEGLVAVREEFPSFDDAHAANMIASARVLKYFTCPQSTEK
jgi:hypothetical protein